MERRPKTWIAVVLSVLTPPLGMLYLRRPLLAGMYVIAAFGLVVLIFSWGDFSRLLPIVVFAFPLVAGLHAFKLAPTTPLERPKKWYSRAYGIVGIAAALAAGLIILRVFFVEPFVVPATSMLPNIRPGSLILVKKLGYGNYATYGIRFGRSPPTATISRGDVLAFEFPKNRQFMFVKRVVGVPGDHVEYRDNRLFLNGRDTSIDVAIAASGESEVMEFLDGHRYAVAHDGRFPSKDADDTVSAGHIYVMGDNRDNAVDSRYWGEVPWDHIVGKVIYVLAR